MKLIMQYRFCSFIYIKRAIQWHTLSYPPPPSFQTSQRLPCAAALTAFHGLYAPHKYNVICVGHIHVSGLLLQRALVVLFSDVPKESKLVLEKGKRHAEWA